MGEYIRKVLNKKERRKDIKKDLSKRKREVLRE